MPLGPSHFPHTLELIGTSSRHSWPFAQRPARGTSTYHAHPHVPRGARAASHWHAGLLSGVLAEGAASPPLRLPPLGRTFIQWFMLRILGTAAVFIRWFLFSALLSRAKRTGTKHSVSDPEPFRAPAARRGDDGLGRCRAALFTRATVATTH